MSNWKLPRKNWIKMIEIITIGDEILIGQIVDTNSAWMSVQLNKAGFPISQITSVHDDEEQILNTLNRAISGNDIVLITGGLGPTKDDITKLTLCSYFKPRLVFDESVYQHVTKLYSHRPSVMNELTGRKPWCLKIVRLSRIRWGQHPSCGLNRMGRSLFLCPVFRSRCKRF